MYEPRPVQTSRERRDLVSKVIGMEETAVNTAAQYTLGVIDVLESVVDAVINSREEAGERFSAVPSRACLALLPVTRKQPEKLYQQRAGQGAEGWAAPKP